MYSRGTDKITLFLLQKNVLKIGLAMLQFRLAMLLDVYWML